jgi:site-specific DNA recombinase
MKKFVTFARVSSREQQQEGFSLDVQADALAKYAALNDGEVTKSFRIAETASKQKGRKEFQKVLAHVKKNAARIDGLLVYKIDRAVRNLPDLIELERLESEYGVPVICVTQPTDSTPAGQMMRRTLANIATYQTEQQSLDVREGLARRVADGLFAQRAAFGYENYHVDRRALVRVHAENGPKVKRIFQLYAFLGHTIDSLIEQLGKEGIIYCPSRPRFNRSSIHRLLGNRAYIGQIKFHEEWHPGTHEPLIDSETWNRVQGRLGDRQYQSSDLTYARELIRCGHCGHAITGELVKKKYIYYRCARNTKGDHPRVRLTEKVLEQQVLGLFNQLEIDDEGVRGWFARVLHQKTHDGREYRKKQRADLQRQLTTAINRQNSLLDRLLDKEIDEGTARRKEKELGDRVADLTRSIKAFDRTDEATAPVVNAFELSKGLRVRWATADLSVKRRILNGLFLNCRLDGRTLVPEWRQPFGLIAKLA